MYSVPSRAYAHRANARIFNCASCTITHKYGRTNGEPERRRSKEFPSSFCAMAGVLLRWNAHKKVMENFNNRILRAERAERERKKCENKCVGQPSVVGMSEDVKICQHRQPFDSLGGVNVRRTRRKTKSGTKTTRIARRIHREAPKVCRHWHTYVLIADRAPRSWHSARSRRCEGKVGEIMVVFLPHLRRSLSVARWRALALAPSPSAAHSFGLYRFAFRIRLAFDQRRDCPRCSHTLSTQRQWSPTPLLIVHTLERRWRSRP